MIKTRVVIVGGGFGGVETARTLAPYAGIIDIVLVSKQESFLYYPALYQLAGKNATYFSVLRVTDMLPKQITFIRDEVIAIKPKEKKVSFFDREDLSYDILVLALGSVTEDFGTPGVREHMCQFRTLEDIYCLRGIMDTHRKSNQAEPLVIIGGGPSGVELAASIATLFKKENKGVEPTHEQVVIIEGAPTLVSQIPEKAKAIVLKRAVRLGIGVYTNARVLSYDGQILKTSTGEFASKTVVWAAGLAAHPLLKEVNGEYDKKGRIMVNEYLETTVDSNIFAIGDSASTMRAGLAQAAIHDGEFVGRSIVQKIKGKKRLVYKPPHVEYAIPLGPYWAIASLGPIVFKGIFGSFIRKIIDFHYLLTHVKIGPALRIFSKTEGK